MAVPEVEGVDREAGAGFDQILVTFNSLGDLPEHERLTGPEIEMGLWRTLAKEVMPALHLY